MMRGGSFCCWLTADRLESIGWFSSSSSGHTQKEFANDVLATLTKIVAVWLY